MKTAESLTQLPTPIGAPTTPEKVSWPAKYPVLKVLVSATDYRELTKSIVQAASLRQSSIVSCHAVHPIVLATESIDLNAQINAFEAVTPDGQPVRWALNWLHRLKLRDRVYGPELMLRVCEAAANEGIAIYLYGGTPEVLDRLSQRLLEKFPKLKVSGEAPPFRPLTEEEDQQVVERIRQSEAGCVFIGLGSPKQDEFAFAHRDQIAAVQICVGAAFDFHAGTKRMAPAWMQRSGLEWSFRLYQEPGRLWRRYAYTNIRFLFLLSKQWIGKL